MPSMNAITTQMINELIRLAEIAKRTKDERPVEAYLSNLTFDQQAEFLALVWYGRDDAVDGPIPFDEQVEYAKKNVDDASSYIAAKSLVLADYLRNGLSLLRERGEG